MARLMRLRRREPSSSFRRMTAARLDLPGNVNAVEGTSSPDTMCPAAEQGHLYLLNFSELRKEYLKALQI